LIISGKPCISSRRAAMAVPRAEKRMAIKTRKTNANGSKAILTGRNPIRSVIRKY
jgi:hypothetical protein